MYHVDSWFDNFFIGPKNLNTKNMKDKEEVVEDNKIKVMCDKNTMKKQICYLFCIIVMTLKEI